MRIAFYGSSLLSSYWNGAATYYRGILRELAERGQVSAAAPGSVWLGAAMTSHSLSPTPSIASSIATSIRLNGRAWLSILPRPKR